MTAVLIDPEGVLDRCKAALDAGRNTIDVSTHELRALATLAKERQQITQSLRESERHYPQIVAHDPVSTVQFLLGWFLGSQERAATRARILAVAESNLPEVACPEPALAPSGNESPGSST